MRSLLRMKRERCSSKWSGRLDRIRGGFPTPACPLALGQGGRRSKRSIREKPDDLAYHAVCLIRLEQKPCMGRTFRHSSSSSIIWRSWVTVGYLLCPHPKPATKLLDSHYRSDRGACGFVLTAHSSVTSQLTPGSASRDDACIGARN